MSDAKSAADVLKFKISVESDEVMDGVRTARLSFMADDKCITTIDLQMAPNEKVHLEAPQHFKNLFALLHNVAEKAEVTYCA